MSNTLAIAAVTATLRNLVNDGLKNNFPSFQVTTKPPDKARSSNPNGDPANQVNLFLYNVAYDAAWLNMNMPNQVKPNETGFPPLPLVLYYLITTYGDDTTDPNSDKLLGAAMSVLHDHPLLFAEEIKAALAGNDLGDQIERVRITPQQLSVDDMSKLWTTFQTSYRVSVAYQVSVVLIESTRAPRTPLPVLTRGEDDSGVQSEPGLTPPFPTLTAITMLGEQDVRIENQPAGRLGETIILEGFHLDGNTVTAQFKHPRLKGAISVPTLAGGTSTKATVKIPDTGDAPETWASGIYTVSLLIKKTGEQNRETNELPFALAPKITSLNVIQDDTTATVEVECVPHVLTDQLALLLLSDKDARQIRAKEHETTTDPLEFEIKNAPVSAAGFYVRLRVDGVDSLLVKDYSAKPLKFDEDQKVKIT